MTSQKLSVAPVVRPFHVRVADEVRDRILERVRAFRWAGWEEQTEAVDWRYGPPASFMRALCEYWSDGYDWRVHEQSMNAMAQFVTNVDAMDLHFIHERGSGNNPVPLLIAHGWPYSTHSYAGLIGQLTHPEQHGGATDDAFSVVVPSFPGYDFSSRPPHPMGPLAVALLFDKLMMRLGYERYMVHGGDWGGHITSLLGFHRPKCKIARNSGSDSFLMTLSAWLVLVHEGDQQHAAEVSFFVLDPCGIGYRGYLDQCRGGDNCGAGRVERGRLPPLRFRVIARPQPLHPPGVRPPVHRSRCSAPPFCPPLPVR